MGGSLLRVVCGCADFLHRGACVAGVIRLSAVRPLRQHAELTFKQNRQHGRHGWLRLTPAYSVRLVEQILEECAEHADVVFDPFSGTGTTALCAAYRGRRGVATDINPFLIWLARAKASAYDSAVIESFEAAARLAAHAVASGNGPLAECPPLSNIERWWRPAALTFLRRLKAALHAREAGERMPVGTATLLRVAFCRTMMKLSNAAFNHQSMSFRTGVSGTVARITPADEQLELATFAAQFLSDVGQVAAGAADNPAGAAEYVLADARDCEIAPLRQWRNRVDLLITSPPYPNRMSYIRELRPYMYWLGFLSTGRQAGELDWSAVGGTWGVATSRLSQWAPCGKFIPPSLQAVLKKIRAANAENGTLLANYVHKYFEDMLEHLFAMVVMLKPGGTAHYIIGNSIFYGHEVAAEQFLAEQMAVAGLCDVRIVPLRRRNSKGGLVEFRVSARRGPV
ncbi:MAG: DNA adenine methylase [Sinobacteraceae bacterium]|nr:DNA adenine methylase [Nevskiaceae bacterium]